ncbi:MAG: pantoate--beta-alanine ligase [Deltaproteobacteria bacterium]|nr:pantoate--beta-alanine ligase [Deltaproteobacteria bacterium]
MRVIKGIEEMKGFSSARAAQGRSVALVPTMGCLHKGHLELLKKGRSLGDALVMSIFVNPLQFGPKEDYKAYPRDMERDIKIAGEAGVDVVFAPESSEVYPEGHDTFVDVEKLSRSLCGVSRPWHFRGVATVVLKLFNIVRPQKAVFGKKDFQQFLIIQKMVGDLNLDVELIPVETVREPDGLAMSSRNGYLNPVERKAAAAIPASLRAAKDAYARGERNPSAIMEDMKKIIENEGRAVIEYITVCDPITLKDISRIGQGALVAVAVRIGATRLIDNILLQEE